jgi:S1-C subfamily serine protease
MWINARDSGFEVAMIAPNSPASESDLKVGDIITEVGGRRASSSDLSRVRRALRTLPPNTTDHVKVSRDGVASGFDLVLRDRI